ncbi:MAG TPA: sensor domain-containing diguanylate cyclase [Elusimicrobiota bacterium]|nr:sensor domain-containing diguanylate cyclase [Elusimicrobiota bacterium]
MDAKTKSSSGQGPYFIAFIAFLSLAVAMLAWPSKGALLFPFITIFVVVMAWVMTSAVSGLLILMASLVCLGLWNLWLPEYRLFLTLGVLQLWALWYFLQTFDHQTYQNQFDLQNKLRYRQKRLDEIRKEMVLYDEHSKTIQTQATQRQILADCARDFGSLLDVTEIQRHLMDWGRKIFPDAHVILAGLIQGDPIDDWIRERRRPLLCEDILQNNLFHSAHTEQGTRSLLVTALIVNNQVYGALRLESLHPNRFDRNDLRLLEALATLGSMAFDNALLYQRVEQLAIYDGLTRVLTRRAFEEKFAEELLRAGRYRYPVGVVMVDVDHFKKVNDTHGHAVGDQVLQMVTRILKARLRPVDTVGRYGGEEFIALLPQLGHVEVKGIVEGIRQVISQEPCSSSSGTFHITLSAGVASYPEDATTTPQLIRTADQRLYQAKTQGRNRVVGIGDA